MNPKYQDMLQMERPQSKHPKLTATQRAGQFSPFAALTGFEEKIEEGTREAAEYEEMERMEISE